MYYLKSRYYSPTLGRFLTRDAIGFIKHSDPQTLNLYSYCGNNPVSFTDPSGYDYYGYDENGFDDASIAYTGWEKIQLNDLGYQWRNGGNQASLHSQALAIRKAAIDRMIASLPPTGTPNSTGRLYNPDGSVKQERVYGPDGKAVKDTDYNHPGDNHDFPHEHVWNDGKRGPAQKPTIDEVAPWAFAGGAAYWIISEGSRLFPPRNLIPVP